MKIYYKLILLICCILLMGDMKAQKANIWEDLPKYTVAVQPLQLSNGGLRLDFEKQLKNPKNWLQVHITGYYLSQRVLGSDYWETPYSDFDPISGLKGIGIGGAYKSFFYKSTLYYSAGISYTHFRVKYPSHSYLPYTEDGLTFYEQGYQNIKQVFNKISPSINIGAQSNLSNGLFFDTYIGLAYSASFFDSDKYAFDDNPYGYGYRGVFFTGGVRVGFAFGK